MPTLQEVAERGARVVAEARAWVGTPFVHQGAVKGVGIDCVMLLLRTYQAAGILPADFPDPRPYPRGWMLARGSARYAGGILTHAARLTCTAREVAAIARPGDVALFRVGRAEAHGAIVAAWPTVIHAKAEYLEDGWSGEVVEAPVTSAFFDEHPFASLWRPHALREDEAA